MYIKNLSRHDICKLADLSSRVIHRIDFPELGELDLFRGKLVRLLDELQEKYQNNELLFDMRCAIVSQPFYKLKLYKLTRRIVQIARGRRAPWRPKHGIPVSPETSPFFNTRLKTLNTAIN